MSESPFEALEQTLRERLDYWCQRLFLSSWTRTAIWRQEPCTDDGAGGRVTQACIDVQWEYQSFTVQFFLPTIYDQNLSTADLDRIIVHELLHAVVKEMERFTDPRDTVQHTYTEERTVSWLTSIVCGIHEAQEAA